MSWYSVSLLFKATHLTRPQIDPLWEERILLIQANTEDEAKREAMRIGKEDEPEYSVVDGQPGEAEGKVKWTFEQIESVCEIETDSLANGTQLFWRFLRDSEVKSILTPFPDDE